jgi:hypothetical protein
LTLLLERLKATSSSFHGSNAFIIESNFIIQTYDLRAIVGK